MKRISILSALVLLGGLLMAQTCIIQGRMIAPIYQGKMLYLVNANTGDTVQSALLKDSVFQFSVPVQEPYIAHIMTEGMPGCHEYYTALVVESGKIYCDMIADSVAGTASNDRYQAFVQKRNAEVATYREIIAQLRNPENTHEQKLQIRNKLTQQWDVIENYVKNTYRDNKDNAVGALAMGYLLDLGILNYEEATSMLQGAGPIVREYKHIKEAVNTLENAVRTAVGKDYIDVQLIDFNTDEPVMLSQHVNGHLTLIDFWASWCRPCRAEIPYIADIFRKYGDKITVISINVWDEKEKQAAAIEELHMDWLQLTAPDKAATNAYGIQDIPQIMLIDSDGTILARDLSGEEIEEAVKKMIH